ncbi:hypothetical protein TNCV_3825201 [Trichonephila clavipes]|nr:hypothetical protein TNCV_3825201 [Trichonephila clavipes]
MISGPPYTTLYNRMESTSLVIISGAILDMHPECDSSSYINNYSYQPAYLPNLSSNEYPDSSIDEMTWHNFILTTFDELFHRID